MRIASLFVVFLSLLGFAHTAAAADKNFPHRAKYAHVPILDAAQLRKDIDRAVIVDVRSRYEYNTLHIKNAVHIPLSKEKLPPAVQELRKKTDRPIVFYCNGTTCKKSYEAAELAMNAGVSNVYAYDAGLELWTKNYPDQSVLMKQTPVKDSDFIDNAKFKERVINVNDFEARVEDGAIVLDVRDLRQRDNPLFPMREKRAQLDETQKLAEVVAEAKRSKKTLLIYDKVGKQVRWLQYYLEQQGVKNYYFLAGGAEGFFEAKFGKPKFSVPDLS